MQLSVIIPTYNRNEMLGKCLAQLRPTVQNLSEEIYEVIVTDDSKENTAKDFLAKYYPWVKWVEGPKKGPAANRNNGAQYATGNWLVFTDDDCLPSENWINTFKNYIQNNMYANVLEGKTIADRPKQRFDEEAPLNLYGGNLWSCNFAIRKSIFDAFDGFDENFPYTAMEDVDFNVRLKSFYHIVFLGEAVVVHPWRRIRPFRNLHKHLASHKHFLLKHHSTIPFSFRLSRVKIAVTSFFKDLISLTRFSFLGIMYFFEKCVLNMRLIFLKGRNELYVKNNPDFP